MTTANAKALLARDARRDIPAEIRRGLREAKRGIKPNHRVHRFDVSEVQVARQRSGLSQPQFADVLGVSARTLQEWEQGRRKPTGAARSLLTIAQRRPDVLRELFAK